MVIFFKKKQVPSINQIRSKCMQDLASLRHDHVRYLNPTPYKVLLYFCFYVVFYFFCFVFNLPQSHVTRARARAHTHTHTHTSYTGHTSWYVCMCVCARTCIVCVSRTRTHTCTHTECMLYNYTHIRCIREYAYIRIRILARTHAHILSACCMIIRIFAVYMYTHYAYSKETYIHRKRDLHIKYPLTP